MTRLVLSVDAGPRADSGELAALGSQLREDLLELDVDTIDFVCGADAPVGAKGVPAELGTLLVTLASGGVLTTLINMLQSWVSRSERRSVTLEIDGDKVAITNISSEEQQQLIDAWLSRHKRK